MPAHRSLTALSLIATLAVAPTAFAQVPGVNVQGPAAGGVPTLQQQPSGEIQQDSGGEPARAPGSKNATGAIMPKAGTISFSLP